MKLKRSKGAGRPQEMTEEVRKTYCLDAHQADWIRSQASAGEVSESKFLRGLIQQLIDQQTISAGSVARSD